MKGILSHKILFFLLAVSACSFLLGANDSVWNSQSSSGSYTSSEFWAAENWTTGTRSDGGYYFAYDASAILTGDFMTSNGFFLGYASTDGSRVLNSNSGSGTLTVQGDASFSALGVGIQWGNTHNSGSGNLTVNGSLNVSGNLEVGRNGTSTLKAGTENVGETVTIGTSEAPVRVQFSSQASSSAEFSANPTQIDFRSIENVQIYADNFLIGATATGLIDPYDSSVSSYKFQSGADVFLGTNNTISANYLILASSYGVGLTNAHSTLEFGEGTNDVSIGTEMIVGGLKADKSSSDAADAVNVVSVRNGGTFALHGTDGVTSKATLSIAKSTCDTSNISYGTLDLRGASSAVLTLDTLTIGYKSETDSTQRVRYGGAEGFLYLGDNATLTADTILMAYKSNVRMDTVKYTKGTLDLGGKSSVTTSKLTLGNSAYAYLISEENIRMHGGMFNVQKGAEFFGNVNISIGSDSNGNDGILNIYSEQQYDALQNNGLLNAELSNTAILASCSALISISGKGEQNVYGDVVCVKETSNSNGFPGGDMEINLTDEGKFHIYGNFQGGYDLKISLTGNSAMTLEGTTSFLSRNITILDENGTIQTDATHGCVVKNVSENALYHVTNDVSMKGNSEITVSGNASFFVDGSIEADTTYEAVTYKYNAVANEFDILSQTTSNGNAIFTVSGGTVDINDVSVAGTFHATFSGGKTYIESIQCALNDAKDEQSLKISGGEVWLKTVQAAVPAFETEGMTAPKIEFTGGNLAVLELGTSKSPFSLEQIQANSDVKSVFHVGDSVTTALGVVTETSKFGISNIHGNYTISGGTLELDFNGLRRDFLNVSGIMDVTDAGMELNVGENGIEFDGSFVEDGKRYEYITLVAAGTFADLTETPETGERIVSTLDFNYLWSEKFTEGWTYFIYANGQNFELQAAQVTRIPNPEPAASVLLFLGCSILVGKRFVCKKRSKEVS